MNSTDPHSSDFSYKKYSLEQLDNWVNDALNCEDLSPQDIYDTIVNVVDESVEYHKKYLTKSIELLSLLKGHREVDFGDEGNILWVILQIGMTSGKKTIIQKSTSSTLKKK